MPLSDGKCDTDSRHSAYHCEEIQGFYNYYTRKLGTLVMNNGVMVYASCDETGHRQNATWGHSTEQPCNYCTGN